MSYLSIIVQERLQGTMRLWIVRDGSPTMLRVIVHETTIANDEGKYIFHLRGFNNGEAVMA